MAWILSIVDRLPILQGWEFAHSLIAHLLRSLRSLRTNGRLWANPQDRSGQMSNSERIAQIAQDKWAGLGIRSSVFWANHSFLAKKWAICSKKRVINSFLVSALSKSLMVAHFWWAAWGICSHWSFLVSDLTICNEQWANEWWTNEQIPSPANEWPWANL